MKTSKSFLAIGILLIGFLSNNFRLIAQTDSIADREGNFYQIVQIGDQWWMAENLRATLYANGDPIQYLPEALQWDTAATGAYCYYDNDTSQINSYGMLYNWYTATDERGVCPENWHVPSDMEWITLEKYLGMSTTEAARMTAWRGTDEGNKLKAESFNGTNSSGFSALGTGYRDPAGVYKAMGTDNDYWTSTAYNNDGSTEGILHGLVDSKSTVVRNFHIPGYGFCIRCIKNQAVGIQSVTLQAGPKVYPNPAVNQLFVNLVSGEEYSIKNLQGQTIIRSKFTGENQPVDISCLDPGAYILCVMGPSSSRTATFLKQ
jgi:uncharacterized protein (TIGR02145 family)